MIPINKFSRPGLPRTKTVGIVFHWTGVAMQEAWAVERYFKDLALQNPHDDKPDKYGSAHFVVGLDGEVVYLIPEEEVAYHCGAEEYTNFWSSRYPQYCHNVVGSTPNYALIGVEMCHETSTGRFNPATLDGAAKLGIDLLNKHHLGYSDVYRHYDITGKPCPKFWVEQEKEWLKFRKRLREGTDRRKSGLQPQ